MNTHRGNVVALAAVMLMLAGCSAGTGGLASATPDATHRTSGAATPGSSASPSSTVGDADEDDADDDPDETDDDGTDEGDDDPDDGGDADGDDGTDPEDPAAPDSPADTACVTAGPSLVAAIDDGIPGRALTVDRASAARAASGPYYYVAARITGEDGHPLDDPAIFAVDADPAAADFPGVILSVGDLAHRISVWPFGEQNGLDALSDTATAAVDCLDD